MKTEMLAMILAGGRGSRLYDLTNKSAKPAVYFGGKYRIIDFPLSNCANSNIGVVGILTQYESILLNSYAAQGSLWGLEGRNKGSFVLSPREKSSGFGLYQGTADAIYQNIDFMDQYDPEYVVILSGDHIYKMDYDDMLATHKANNADLTIAVLEVPWAEASRFGIMNCDSEDRIVEFEEKPKNPKSNLASMGIYIFSYKALREALINDAAQKSDHDFGKNIIPTYLKENKRIFAYRFKGYWKDVGTVDSLWEANMDLLDPENTLQLYDDSWKIYTEDKSSTPQYIGVNAEIDNSIINQGTVVKGTVKNSVIFHDVVIEEGATVNDSVVMPGTVIKAGAVVTRCIVGENMTVESEVGNAEKVTLVA